MRPVLVALVVVALVGCAADDPPALDVDGVEVPDSTSDTLGSCPAGGADATTPPAGCLDADGQVRRP